MIRIVSVLSLLSLAASSSIPIHRHIDGPGGLDIDVDIQVDIDSGDDAGGSAAIPTVPARLPISTTQPPLEEGQCMEKGDFCMPSILDSCCEGLVCKYNPCRARFPWCGRHTCAEKSRESDEKGQCMKKGDYTRSCSRLPNLPNSCCEGLVCKFQNCLAWPHPYCGKKICVEKKRPEPIEEPTCVATGQDCTPGNRMEKCCPNNLCDLDNRKCVRVAYRQNL